MFNWCVFIGVVCGDVDLARDRDGHIRITFQLAIQFLDKPVGKIEVLGSNHLTFLAAKYLRLGDRVAVMGFLSMREWQSDAGEWHNDATLTAMDLELIKGDDHNQG
ncbi:MAG: single-stranded DNA-binding protein [Desulfobaccales bacterium]